MGGLVTRGCLNCGTPIPTTRSRCRPCRATWERVHRGGREKRGYDARHQRRARQQVLQSPVCRDCGATTDLTAGHVRHGDATSPLITQCRSCNTAERNRRRTNVTGVPS